MADNTTLDAGAGGDTIATDDIGGVKFPRSKIVIGADGSNDGDVSAANPMPALVTGAAAENAAVSGNPVLSGGRYDSTPRTLGDGDVGALALDADGAVHVSDGGNSLTVDNGGTFAVQVDGAALTALQIMDDWDETDRCKVNPIVGQAGVAAGAGTVGVTTQRVTIATDDATAANVQTVADNTDILNNWDAASRCSVSPISGQAGVAGGAGAVGATTQRMTLASDDPGVALLTTIDADTGSMATLLGTIDSDTSSLAGCVSGTELQVDVVGALPAGTNNIGDVDVASIAAGANLIGDVGIQGRATGGLSLYYDNDIDETAVAVKASAGTLYGIHAINTTAAPLYLQFFDVAQGSVTVGTTTPTMQMIVPGNADSDGAGFTFTIPQGIAFSTAITLACSTNSEGNGAPGANACHVNLFYK